MEKERRPQRPKAASETGTGQSALTRTQALIAAAILLTAIVGLAYLAVMLMKPGSQGHGIPTPFPTSTPSANYSLSPLIAEYGIDQTPSLVINCNRRVDGTFALKEQNGEVPAGSERNSILSSLCTATGRQDFCSRAQPGGARTTVTGTSHPNCSGEGGKVLIFAFHSPSCSYCGAQWPTLQMLAAEMPESIELARICTPSTLAEDPLCETAVRAGLFRE